MSIFFSSAVMLIAVFMIAMCAAYLFWNRTQVDKSVEDPAHTPEKNLVGDRFRILNADELIHTLNLSAPLLNIKTNLGLSDENWQKDAVPFLNCYIDFVQRLPASESHHHAGDGGLVKHTLDVAALSLIASTGQSWPPAAKTEIIAQKTAVWRYGIMCAAILHDVGKTLTSYRIKLYPDAVSQDYRLWMPDAGSMADTGQQYYRVEFPDAKSPYATHANIAWTFFQALVPTHVRQWIAATDPKLVVALRSYLTGEKENSPLHNLITHADMASVARDLRAGSRQRFASAKRTPLIETIMDTLIEMLADRGAHFSIAITAGGDLFRKGDYVYMVAKNVPDYIRQFLRQNQYKAAASFPADNQRIYDVLLEYGAVIPPAADPNKAINYLDVVFKKGDGEVKSHIFTVLKFRLSSLYPEEPYPAEFQGGLEEVAARPATSVAEENHPRPSESATDEHSPQPPESDLMPGMLTEPKTEPKKVETTSQDSTPRTSKSKQPQPILKFSNIDDLLSGRGLIQEDLEQVDPDKQTVVNCEMPLNKPMEMGKSVAAVSKKNKAAAQTQTRKSNESGGLNLLNDLFGKSGAKSTLPDHETARYAKAAMDHEKQLKPASTPRPVHVALPPDLDGIISAPILPSSALEPDETEVIEDPSPSSIEVRVEALRDHGARFLSWLADGLASGDIQVNQSYAPVHFIERGMLLVSPAIFRDYAGGVFNKFDPTSLGPMAQKGFEQLKLHQRTRRSALYRAIAVRNQQKKLFMCYLIPEQNIKHIIQPSSRPQNNTDIMLDDELELMMKKDSK